MSHLQNQNSGGHLIQVGGTMAYGGRVRTPMNRRSRPTMGRGGRTPMRGRSRPTMGRGRRAPMQRGRNPMSMMEDGGIARSAMRRSRRR